MATKPSDKAVPQSAGFKATQPTEAAFSRLQAKLCTALVNENKILLKENQRLRAALKEERRALEDDGEFITEDDIS